MEIDQKFYSKPGIEIKVIGIAHNTNPNGGNNHFFIDTPYGKFHIDQPLFDCLFTDIAPEQTVEIKEEPKKKSKKGADQ